MTQNGPSHKPVLMQAPVRALDPDGLAVVGSGTVAFVVGLIVCWIYADTLVAQGRGWYLQVAVAGTVIGLIGLTVGLLRRRRRGNTELGRRSVEQAGVDADGVPDRE